MKKRGLFLEQDKKLYLTDKGKRQYYNALSQESKRILKNKKKFKNWEPPTKNVRVFWCLFGVLIPIILVLLSVFVGPILYNYIINLIK
ncbi:MAG: hypothetical protein ACFFDH_12180 [Promethearchaeota archaeon]